MLKCFSTALSALALGMLSAQAEEVTASGCAAKGVEAACIVLKGAGKTYNITAAKPTPKLGEYGTVKGTISTGPTTCMQGTVLSPSTWTPNSAKKCPR